MVITIIYVCLILFLINKNSFFGLFDDKHISNKQLSLLFIVKLLAIPVFYYLFVKDGDGIKKLDAGKFFNDASMMNYMAFVNPAEYLRMLLGFQDESAGSWFYDHIFILTDNWDNGKMKDYFYNDNRMIIRLHSLVHFAAFGSYFVHALFCCFISFIGLFLIYKTYTEYFTGKAIGFMTLICLFPSLWLHSGGLLKEGWLLLIMGSALISLKKVILHHQYKYLPLLIISVLLSFILKPYVLLLLILLYVLFLFTDKFVAQRFRIITFSLLFVSGIMVTNAGSQMLRGRSLIEAALQREKEFSDVAEGGIFMLDKTKFIRLPYDHSQLLNSESRKGYYRLREGSRYYYWEHSHQKDTLFCNYNRDTLTEYRLMYEIPKAGSNIKVVVQGESFVLTMFRSFYYTLLYPFFVNAKGFMYILASLENLLLIFSLIFCLYHLLRFRSRKAVLVPIMFLTFAISLFLLVGITSPNSGAIMRYRSPAAIFILLSALYFMKPRILADSVHYK